MQINTSQKLSYLVLRLMSSFIFIVAGLNHLLQTTATTARLQQAALGPLATWIAPAETLVLLSGAGLLTGGVMLLTGYKTKLAAILLLAILLPITLTIQLTNPAGMGPLFKNVALFGVLLFFSTNGAMYYGLDQVLKQGKKKQPELASSATGTRNGKLLKVLAMAAAFMLGSCTVGSPELRAQSAEQQTAPKATPQAHYAVLISQPNHLKAAVNTAEMMQADQERYNTKSFVIMACGKSVEAFLKEGTMAEVIAAGKAAGVTYRICGMSLRQFNIKESQLIDGIEIVPNGLTHMFDLKLQGYSTVEL